MLLENHHRRQAPHSLEGRHCGLLFSELPAPGTCSGLTKVTGQSPASRGGNRHWRTWSLSCITCISKPPKSYSEIFVSLSWARLLHARVPSFISCFFSKRAAPLPLLYFILAWQIHLLSFMANSTSSVKDP